MEWIIKVSFSLVVLLSEGRVTNSKYIEGTLTTLEDWHFLERFCFSPRNGKLKFVFDFPVLFQPMSLLFYYDRETQWPSIYKKGLTCREMIEPTIGGQGIQQIPLHEDAYSCQRQNNAPIVHCEKEQSFSSSREMWWYLAISRCMNTTNLGIIIDYKLHLTNGNKTDFFFYEFSADEFYILQTDIAFMLACLVLLILAIISADILRKRMMFHTTFKIFLFSLSCECIYLIIMIIYYGKYGSDGRDNYSLKTFGRIIEVAGILSFVVMLLLMAKGFTITRGRISSAGSIKITIFMTLYTVTYGILFFYDATFSDPGEVVYLYQSPPGYGIIGLRILAWIYFTFATLNNMKHYKEKSKFYIPFYILFTLWFWAGFIVVLVANFALDKWVRARVTNGVDCAVSFGGFLFLLFLTRPSNSNKNFPYHVRTSQIGILADDGPDDLGGRAYEPEETESKGPDLSALFAISNYSSNHKNASDGSLQPVKEANELQDKEMFHAQKY